MNDVYKEDINVYVAKNKNVVVGFRVSVSNIGNSVCFKNTARDVSTY
ncbi:hypothetical protein ES703_45119 [subsurface metagenome]